MTAFQSFSLTSMSAVFWLVMSYKFLRRCWRIFENYLIDSPHTPPMMRAKIRLKRIIER